tara:strand:+ start:4100 stop:5284 length:1185 start_codon:yes stop_codon:yes gene_type:complete
MNKNLNKTISAKTILIFLLIVYGFYLCFVGGYGSDEDTLPMIYVFEKRLLEGTFVSSRFTSYPVAEIGIGFLSYYVGSWLVNSVTFFLYLVGISIFYLSFFKKIDLDKFQIYLILCLSSTVLFFENLEPMGYSWAFFFFAAGTFFLSRRIFELAILAFAFAVGTRMNFLIFALIAIFFFQYDEKINNTKKIILSFCTFIIGGLFYLPIWFENGFDLTWITAARPIEQGFIGLLARFSYKVWLTIGVFQFFIIAYLLNKNFFTKKKLKKYKLIFLLILANLLLFLYIPAELSYMQPALIFLYFALIQEFNKKLIIALITLNFMNWVINFDILNVQYKDNSRCGPKHAISANFKLSTKPGNIENFFLTRDMINCWVDAETPRGKRIIEGKSTKIKD